MLTPLSCLSILAFYGLLVNVITTKGGATTACAACKYQRKKCSKDCPLSPFFPPNEPKRFQYVHRLFGVCNILKILKQVSDAEKEDAMKSIIYESDMRARFPVHGCCWVICQLKYQLQAVIEELRYVHTQLAVWKHQSQCQIVGPSDYSPSSKLQLVIDNAHHDVPTIPFAANEFLVNRNIVENNEEMMKTLSIQESPFLINSNSLQQKFSIQQEMDVSYYCDGMPFDSIVDDRQSYIESKEACESSAESSLKDTTQSIELITENDLKSAAASFSLRSIK